MLRLLLLLCAPAFGQGLSFVQDRNPVFDFEQHQHNEFGDCLFNEGNFCEAERMTGAVAVGDYDGDGLDDLYFSRLGPPGVLLRNLGEGNYEDATAGSGLDLPLNANGATWVDVDGDGDLDLYLTSLATHRYHLFINEEGHFTEEAGARGAGMASLRAHYGWSIAVGDYDGDGWIDLVPGEWYLSFVSMIHDSHFGLLRNLGPEQPGHFEAGPDDESLGLLALTDNGVFAFSPALVDMDDDGRQDLLIASDFGQTRLFWNEPEGFVDGTEAAGVGTDENGMGSAIADYDGDGDLDWFVTSIHDPVDTCMEMICGWGASGNRLYRNEGNRVFVDATDEMGVRDGAWGWGAVFFDPDSDGDLDLVMTNGVDFPVSEHDTPFNRDPMRFWHNQGEGPMVERAAQVGLVDRGSGKGLVTMDYDGDGDQDLIIVNNASGPVVYRNESRQDAWLRVRLVGRAPNTEALGARVWAQGADGRRQVRAIGAQSYYLGQSERVAHFGLGRAQWASVDIRWPDGAEQRVDCLRARQEVRLVQGEPFEGDCAPGEIDALVEDAAVDAALDEGLDLGLDGALDGGLDAGVDAADADLDASDATDADLDAAEVLDQGVVAPDRAVDAAPDRAVDVAPDRAVDAAPDRAVDAVPDRAVDVAADRAVDAAPDRAVDATPDRAVDVAPDRAVDAARPADRGIDARLDASPDARPDARDVSADRATDAPIEDARPQPDRPVDAATVDAAPVDAASPENIAGSSGCDCRAGGHTGNPGGGMFWWLFLPLLRRRR